MVDQSFPRLCGPEAATEFADVQMHAQLNKGKDQEQFLQTTSCRHSALSLLPDMLNIWHHQLGLAL